MTAWQPLKFDMWHLLWEKVMVICQQQSVNNHDAIKEF